MSKGRVGHEEVFIAHLTDAYNISEKYHSDFNHKCVPNNSDTKGIAARKIKVYPMNLTTEVGFATDDSNNAQQHIQIHYASINNQPITYY
jgi:hypothetical protein